MKYTPSLKLPYPEPGDPSTTWMYWQGLAEGVEANVPAVRTGTMLFTFTNQSSALQTANFPKLPGLPVCFSNMRSGSGNTARWMTRAHNSTATSISVMVFNPVGSAGTFSKVEVQWMALYLPAPANSPVSYSETTAPFPYTDDDGPSAGL